MAVLAILLHPIVTDAYAIRRIHRKTFHQYFAAKEVLEYRPIQMATTRTLLKLMLQTPDDFFRHVR